MNNMLSNELRSKQAGSDSRGYIFKENKIISFTNLFKHIFRIYQNEKLDFYHHIIQRNAQMHIKSENLFYQTNLFIDFKI